MAQRPSGRELDAVQLVVDPAALQQFAVGAGLGDAAAVEHHDAVRVLDGRQPVGDDDGGAPAHQRLERRLHVALRFGIERGGGLVEHQHRRVLQQRARDRQPLALPPGELHPVLADEGRESLRHLADELHRVRRLGGRDDVLLRRAVHRPVGDVGRHRVVEQHDVLAHQRDVGAQALERERLEIVPVEQHAPAGRAIEARHQVRERRLARPRGADQRHRLAGCDRKLDAVERRPFRVAVVKTHVLEPDLAARAADACACRDRAPPPRRSA